MRPEFPPLAEVTAEVVSTKAAAFYINRKADTLRRYAKMENPPITPRVFGKQFLWRTADIKALLGVTQSNTDSQDAGVTE